jgi:hypothetical protein
MAAKIMRRAHAALFIAIVVMAILVEKGIL